MKLYALYALNEGIIKSNKGQMIFKTKILIMKILKKHTKDIQFDITTIGTHTIILNALWLQLYNPQID